MTAELARVVTDRPKENPEARDLRGLGGAGKLPTVRLQLPERAPSYQPDHPGSLRTGLQLPKRGSPDELSRL